MTGPFLHRLSRWKLVIAAVASATAASMSVLSGWQRGGWYPERFVWVEIGACWSSARTCCPRCAAARQSRFAASAQCCVGRLHGDSLFWSRNLLPARAAACRAGPGGIAHAGRYRISRSVRSQYDRDYDGTGKGNKRTGDCQCPALYGWLPSVTGQPGCPCSEARSA